MAVRILVVDDEKDVKFLVQQRFVQYIQRGELHFSFAYTGREALLRIRQEQPFEIMVTDIEMPDGDGLSLLTQVKEHSPQTQTIVVSAYDDAHYTQQAFQQGAIEFLTKPLDFKTLEGALIKCLEERNRSSHAK